MRILDDVDLLLHRAHFEWNIERQSSVNSELDVFESSRGEAGVGNRQRIISRREGGDSVETVDIADGGALDAERGRLDHHLSAADHAALRVFDRALDRGDCGLGRRGQRK